MSPLALGLLAVTCLAASLSEAAVLLRTFRHQRSSHDDHGSLLVVMAGIGAGVVVATACALALDTARMPGGMVRFGCGLAVMWLGVALRHWAVTTLGRFFTVVVQVTDEQTVVQHGPYRWVRHPSYTALLVTMVGLGLAMGSWLSLAALVALPTAGLVVRIHVEEAALVAGLGGAYEDYAARTSRLVPGVW